MKVRLFLTYHLGQPVRIAKPDICQRALIPFFLIWAAVGSAAAQPTVVDSAAFNPYSETAMAITGPVILSSERIVFEMGSFLDLELVEPAVPGGWGASGDVPTAKVFRVSGDAGPLRQGNTLCGSQAITYLAAWDEEASGSLYLGIAMFTGSNLPVGVADPSLCATYFFQ